MTVNSPRRVTLQDIADVAKVTKVTASVVLNGARSGTKVSPATRLRIQQVAAELRYTPNTAARALATGRTMKIALQAYGMDRPHGRHVSQVLQNILAPSGYEIFLRNYQFGDLALQASVDGIIQLDCAHDPGAYCGGDRLNVPFVALGAYYSTSTDHVGVDLYPGSRAAVEHLISLGKRRIVHMKSNADDNRRDIRNEAYSDAMSAAGLVEEYILVEEDLRQAARRVLASYIENSGLPDALFCRNDELAIGSYRALYDLGLKVPEDVAIVGCDGIEEGDYVQPPLTTIVSPVEQMCALAWQFLQRRMADPSAPQQSIVLSTKLEVKDSTSPKPRIESIHRDAP